MADSESTLKALHELADAELSFDLFCHSSVCLMNLCFFFDTLVQEQLRSILRHGRGIHTHVCLLHTAKGHAKTCTMNCLVLPTV